MPTIADYGIFNRSLRRTRRNDRRLAANEEQRDFARSDAALHSVRFQVSLHSKLFAALVLAWRAAETMQQQQQQQQCRMQ